MKVVMGTGVTMIHTGEIFKMAERTFRVHLILITKLRIDRVNTQA